MSRDEEKARYRAYRVEAYNSAHGALPVKCLDMHLDSTKHVEVRVDPHQADVMMTEDGAFVAATIWIPRSAIKE